MGKCEFFSFFLLNTEMIFIREISMNHQRKEHNFYSKLYRSILKKLDLMEIGIFLHAD